MVRLRVPVLAVAMAALSLGASPAFAQFTCTKDMPSDRDRAETGGMSIESARQIVASQRAYLEVGAQLPADMTMARNLLTGAKNDCARAANEKKKRIDARMCLADATLLLRRLGDSSADLQIAHCSYVAANTLIKTEDEARALALEGIARTYEESSNPNLAISFRERIPAASQTQIRTIELARLHARGGNGQKADASFGKLNLLQPQPGHQYTAMERDALREWALIRRDVLQNPQAAVEVWARLDTAESHYEVGKFHFNANRPDLAEREYKRVIELKNEPGASARVAEASYLLGIMTARSARTPAAWNEARKYAQDAGYSDPRYKRLTCLALIATGERTALSSSGAESDACQVGMSSTADDYLARGLYLLRRMQFLPKCDARPAAERARCNDDRKASFIRLANDAQTAFAEGLTKPPLTDAAATAPTFDWLLLGNAPRLADLLRTGDKLANSVTKAGNGCTNLVLPAVNSPEHEFFGRFDVLGCEYKQYLP